MLRSNHLAQLREVVRKLLAQIGADLRARVRADVRLRLRARNSVRQVVAAVSRAQGLGGVGGGTSSLSEASSLDPTAAEGSMARPPPKQIRRSGRRIM